MASPVDPTVFRTRSIMPTEAVDELEARKPEWLQNTLNSKWNWIQAVLRKRYDTNAMAADPPETVIQWLVDIVTKEAFDARGYDPSSKSDEEAILGRWRDARAEIKEAADSEKGLFELPLLATDTDQGVTRGGPLAYSEQSPYHWMAGQQDAGQAEDDSET